MPKKKATHGLYEVTFFDKRLRLNNGEANPEYKREAEVVLKLPLPSASSSKERDKASVEHSRQSWLVQHARIALIEELELEDHDPDNLPFSRIRVGRQLM